MHKARKGSFRKGNSCPDSETLLALRSGTLPFMARKQAAAHVQSCDFCSAASQLLSKHAPQGEPTWLPVEMPLALRLYAQTVLSRDKRAERAELGRAA